MSEITGNAPTQTQSPIGMAYAGGPTAEEMKAMYEEQDKRAAKRDDRRDLLNIFATILQTRSELSVKDAAQAALDAAKLLG